MRLSRRPFGPLRTVFVLGALGLLAACADQGSGATNDPEGAGAAAATPPEADYLTQTQYCQALQSTALKADYAGFAGHLSAADQATIVAALQRSFAGRPFDAYTANTRTTDGAHRRVVELRGTGGRLYLYLELERVPGGWTVGRYQLDRNRRRIVTLL